MRIIIGLGNPGEQYRLTRHNTGVDLVDEITKLQATRYKDGYGWRKKKNIMVAEFPDLVLVKSADVFMNESGRMINSLRYVIPGVVEACLPARQGSLRSGDLRDSSTLPQKAGSVGMTDGLIVAHDDLDINLGEYKIQFGKGPKEHGGVNSIENTLGTKEFWRVRVGIENRGGSGLVGEEYVLQRFSREEVEILNGVFEKITKELPL